MVREDGVAYAYVVVRIMIILWSEKMMLRRVLLFLEGGGRRVLPTYGPRLRVLTGVGNCTP